jgi:hypothetical protein
MWDDQLENCCVYIRAVGTSPRHGVLRIPQGVGVGDLAEIRPMGNRLDMREGPKDDQVASSMQEGKSQRK